MALICTFFEKQTPGVDFYLKLKDGQITQDDLETLAALKSESLEVYSQNPKIKPENVEAFANKYDKLIADARNRLFESLKNTLMEENRIFQDKNNYLSLLERELSMAALKGSATIAEIKKDIDVKSKEIEVMMGKLEPQTSKPKVVIEQGIPLPPPPPPPPPPVMAAPKPIVFKKSQNSQPLPEDGIPQEQAAAPTLNLGELLSTKLRSRDESRGVERKEAPQRRIIPSEDLIEPTNEKIKVNSLSTYEKSVIVNHLEAQQKEQNTIINQLTTQLKSLNALEEALAAIEAKIQIEKENAKKESMVNDLPMSSAPPPPPPPGPPPMMMAGSKKLPLAKNVGKNSNSSVVEEAVPVKKEDLVNEELRQKMEKNQAHRVKLDQLAEERAAKSAEDQMQRIEEEARKRAEKEKERKETYRKYDKSESYTSLQEQQKIARFEKSVQRIDDQTRNVLRETNVVNKNNENIGKIEARIAKLDELLKSGQYLSMLQDNAQNEIILEEVKKEVPDPEFQQEERKQETEVDELELEERKQELSEDMLTVISQADGKLAIAPVKEVDIAGAKLKIITCLKLLEKKWNQCNVSLKRESAQNFITFCNEIIPLFHDSFSTIMRAKASDEIADMGTKFQDLEGHLQQAKTIGGTKSHRLTFHASERNDAAQVANSLLAKVSFYSNAIAIKQAEKQTIRGPAGSGS